jgi:hypothetical protein
MRRAVPDGRGVRTWRTPLVALTTLCAVAGVHRVATAAPAVSRMSIRGDGASALAPEKVPANC